jgi:hypothetical protein
VIGVVHFIAYNQHVVAKLMFVDLWLIAEERRKGRNTFLQDFKSSTQTISSSGTGRQFLHELDEHLRMAARYSNDRFLMAKRTPSQGIMK